MPSQAACLRQIPPWCSAPVQIAWVLGCASQLLQAQLWPLWRYAGVLGLALTGVLALAAARRGQGGKPWAAGLVCLAVLALGWASTGWRAANMAQQALAPALQGVDVVVQGVVVSLPQRTDRGQRWLFAPEQVLPPGGAAPDGPRVGPPRLPPLPPLLALSHYEGEGLQVQPGQRWQWLLRLQPPHGARNPFGFDAELWWWAQGVQAVGYVRPGPRMLLGSTWQAPLAQARAWVGERLRTSQGEGRAAAVVLALVTGEQGVIHKADWQLFRDTGVAHLVSISGLHITMFAWLAVALVGQAWRRSAYLCLRWPAPLAAAWAGLALALLYALFSGWGIPAQRTLLMLACVVLLRSLGLHWPWPRVWLLVLAVVVAWEPWALLQAGFWLSFVAVGVLFLGGLGQLDHDKSSGPRRWWHPAWQLLREQLRISLALAPLTVLLFGQVSIVGVLANLWAIPWVTLVLTPLAMLGVLVPPCWTLAVASAQALLAALAQMAQWPLAVAYFAQPPLWLGVAGVLGCLWLLLRWPWPLRALGLGWVLPMLLWQAPAIPLGEFSLLALDVGQGSSVLLRTAGHSLLVDAGPRWSTGDAGSQHVLPLLRAYGVRLDTLVLTHADADHTGGAASVLAAYPQAQVLGSGLEQVAQPWGRPWTACQSGQRWQWDGVELAVLWPQQAARQPSQKNTNAQSCVLQVRSASGAVALLTGDMERAQEEALLSSGAEVRADLLLVAHHGSKTSTSAPWLGAVQPQVAIVQSGWRNRFGHPAQAVVQRLHSMHVALLRNTATCGAVHWDSRQPHEAPCERALRPRYWQTWQTSAP